MKMSLKNKLIISFLTVIIICGLVVTIIAVRLIEKGVIQQAQDKVKHDLNSARLIYEREITLTEDIVRFTALRFFIKDAISNNDIELLKSELEAIRKAESLDILTLTDNEGRVVIRTRNPSVSGDSQADDIIVSKALSQKESVAGTEIMSREELLKENEDLARQSQIKIIHTPMASGNDRIEETSGMIIKAAVPIFNNDGKIAGILYGGKLINRNYDIVDKTKEVVYKDTKYKGKDIGTATIFQGGLRISTNVLDNNGKRAIGTLLSDEVYKQVLEQGKSWGNRAFVVNDWYITAYEPIRDVQDNIIGVLYVGVLEEKFIDMRNHTIFIFLSIMLVSMVIVFGISSLLARNILKPVQNLIYASSLWAKGKLDYRAQTSGSDEISKLCETFNEMASSLKERDDKLKEYTNEQIMKSERLSTLGRLAAGVAHEINNPLGGVLMYTHLALEDMEEKEVLRKNLEKTITEATRCKDVVKGLFDFAHQTEPKVELANINDILERTLLVIKNQVLFRNILIKKDLHSSLPKLSVDIGQMQQVFTNIILNAADAMNGHGELTVKTSKTPDNEYIEIEIADTGHGIKPENIDKIFEPFFTTKEVGSGTGLGLAVSYGIITNHHGTIEIQSEYGHGALFIIKLPISQKEK
ncbi:MAG: cache domain-containing protein [Sedimentisphaerales bacterium]|nr:cache domain-containing protein [Sedimentisphaerales bacterium]